jgi:RimJ/RimL family protein N-acetyltransferase
MIVTDRLVLRPHVLEDFSGYHRFWAEKSVSRGGPSPLPALDEEAAWARLLRWIGHWQVFGFGPFLVQDIVSGAVCGEVGLGWFRRGHGADFDTDPEAMWRIGNDFQGRGLALEAAVAALGWADREVDHVRSVCMIDPTNLASVRLAERLGFAEFARRDYHGVELVLFERVRPEGRGQAR